LRRTGGFAEPEPMQPLWAIEPSSLGGLAGEMLRAPLGNSFVVGRSAMPALGQEGELLAAWSVAEKRRRKSARSRSGSGASSVVLASFASDARSRGGSSSQNWRTGGVSCVLYVATESSGNCAGSRMLSSFSFSQGMTL
jgi:hypothetical protein